MVLSAVTTRLNKHICFGVQGDKLESALKKLVTLRESETAPE
jgi:hypothetical protein